jgi:hypothetical protein
MGETTQQRHRCHNPRCRRPFAVVYHRSVDDVPISVAVACPRCGSWDLLTVTTGAVRETPGTWVVPLDHAVPTLQTSSS